MKQYVMIGQGDCEMPEVKPGDTWAGDGQRYVRVEDVLALRERLLDAFMDKTDSLFPDPLDRQDFVELLDQHLPAEPEKKL